MDKAVRKLNTDLSRFRSAEATLKKDTASEKKAVTAAKTDAAAEKKALAAIETQKQSLIKQIEDSFSSTTPPNKADLDKLLGQVYALGEKEVQTKDQYTAKISHDNALAKSAHATVGKDSKAVAADKKQALKDLKPAEYHMNLKDTNRVRKELGLGAVKQVIRPPAPKETKAAKAIDLAKKYLGRFESDLQRHGITQPCPTGESCANFVTSMLHDTGAINFRTLGVADLNNKLRARGWHVVSLKDAKPGDVWICNGAHGESHTELVAKNDKGHVTLIGSNNHPRRNDQQINYDSYSPTISGSFILAPPGH